MIRFVRWLEDILWPRGFKCLCCDHLSEGEPLCPDCTKALKALRISSAAAQKRNVRSVYRYDGVAKQLVLQLKYECAADAAAVLAEGMAEAAREMSLPPDTVLTWVTMPEMRRKKRGIDHGRTLCEAVSARTGLPVRQLMQRKGRIHTQRGLNRTGRLKNLTGSFVCSEALHSPVLLIDDVMTTGATSMLCTSVLLAAGAAQVHVLTATRVIVEKRSTLIQKG